jgi:hypothetical protein
MIDVTLLVVVPTRFVRILRDRLDGVRPGTLREHGPAGLAVVLYDRETNEAAGSVIVSQADHDGAEWIHASIAFTREMPSYEDLAALKEATFGPDRWAYQVFAVASEHVSIHNFALHLWGRADGKPALPDFTEGLVDLMSGWPRQIVGEYSCPTCLETYTLKDNPLGGGS